MFTRTSLSRQIAKIGMVMGAALTLPSLANATVFQAEDYSAFYDTTPGNTGGAYRSDNVDISATNDFGGGFNVGWVEQGEWLVLGTLDVPSSGTYKINVRVASPSGGAIALDLNGGEIPLGDIAIPNTGGWGTWQTVTKTVNLQAGSYPLGVYASTGGWNLNWVEVVPELQAVASNKIQAEDYSAFFDTTPGNIGGAYRTDDVDIEKSSEGGHNVGWIEPTEWLVYSNVTIPSSGTYEVRARVASPNGGQLSFDFNANAVSLGTLNVPSTGGWQTWQTASFKTHMDAGTYNLGLYASTGGYNLDWVEIVPSSTDTPTPTPPPSGRSLTWSDEFDAIDRNTWNFETGGDGWGNSELQYYTDGQNAHIEYDAQAGSNVLVLEARKETGGMCWYGSNCGYTSARMTTNNKKSFQYGRMEARLKLPKAQGIWPAFWMMGNAVNQVSWPDGGEIDIMEHVNTDNVSSGALHGPGYNGNTPITGWLDHPTDLSSEYKLYAVEWDSNSIRWYINDVNFYSVTKAEVEQYGRWVYDQPFWFLLNVAVGGNWPGDPDHANYTTQRMYVDYVRVYQ